MERRASIRERKVSVLEEAGSATGMLPMVVLGDSSVVVTVGFSVEVAVASAAAAVVTERELAGSLGDFDQGRPQRRVLANLFMVVSLFVENCKTVGLFLIELELRNGV